MNTFTTSYASRGRPMQRLSRRALRGLTLIEFLVAIALGLMIVAALTLLIAQQSATQAEFEKSSRQIENGRYAMQILSDDIQMAGYYGEFSAAIAAPASAPDPCSVAVADIEAAMAYPVQAFDSPATSAALTCIPTANHRPNTDILVVRRAEPAITPVASAAVGQAYLQSGLTFSGLEFNKVLGTGSDTSVFTLLNKDKATIAPLRKFFVRIYFISPCSVAPCNAAADGGKPIPTLKMVELTPGGMTPITPLVEGIENLQIDFGVDTTGDGSPDGAFVSTTANWGDVMALRVHLLARNNESSAGYVDTKSYTLGTNAAASAPVGGTAFKRRVFSQMVRLVNPSSRRDQ